MTDDREVDLRIDLDRDRPLVVANDTGHTRWHPDIPPIATIDPGDVVEADVRDGGDRQMATNPGDRSDINRLHPLTGPFHVGGAEPGDLLTVELLAVEADDFGWTAIRRNGKGLMRDAVHEDFITVWRIADGIARSPDLPGVAIKGIPFLGIVGVAPSRERMKAIRAREAAVNEAGGWALMSAPEGAIPPEAGPEGLRTMPPREIGGNLDIKDLAAGARLTLPVNVPGALLSFGDPHFNQGDGESFGTAIEMCARIRFRCHLLKAGAVRWRPRFPYLETPAGAAAREPRAELITVGMSLDQEGREHYLDVSLATRRALTEMTDYLVQEKDFSLGQAQAIVSVAADLRISVVNNPPTIVVCAALPLDIFESADRTHSD
ncbi:MAG: acetamidase/formamidase family protein [Candidatus Dormibacteraeota bacterium]|uniref:Acetamidase/formamidase family protein n=1 Tax=Candidatus Dormiibacter inghamiae TaxID=3127013 RepID=A0A934K878_9BACT|nr:acetamidase/formamidase family protein [Candidatus Dormibacteraeota bacterium]MBJ7605290.1 acetamidase/formamidase family protein [Candidatus Dormibacteraeota bacterium]